MKRAFFFFKWFAVGYAIGLMLALGFASYVNATEDAITALRATTLRLPNGTGFFVKGKSGKAYIMTNFHVCVSIRYRGYFRGSFPSGESFEGRFSKADPTKDLCVGELVNKPSITLELAKSAQLGQDLYTRGYPDGVLMESHGVSERDANWDYEYGINYIGECPLELKKSYNPFNILEGCAVTFKSTLTNLYSRPGSSGSPVVDVNGNLVGVISSWHRTQKYSAGMVTYGQVKRFLETL